MSDLLKSVIQDLINDRSEQAQVTIHEYLVLKTQELAGLSESDDLPEDPDQSPRGNLKVGMTVKANGKSGVIKKFGGDAVYVSHDGGRPEEYDVSEITESAIVDFDEEGEAITEAKWSGSVKTKWSPPEGFFKGSAESIAAGLHRASKTLKQAMSRLNFYVNRAGKNLSSTEKSKLEAAKGKLEKAFA